MGAGLRLQLPDELESCVAEGVAARRCLPLLAALVHVPALHAAELEDAGCLPPSAPTALALQVLLHLLAPSALLSGRLARAAPASCTCQFVTMSAASSPVMQRAITNE